MRLLLVRHAETVDNVAGVYAGSRDSELTAHGVLQARRLARLLASGALGPVRRVLSSDLQRAVDTARAVVEEVTRARSSRDGGASNAEGTADGRDQQPAQAPKTPGALAPLELIQFADLRERDFGAAEGEKFGSARARSLAAAGAESHDQMRQRAERLMSNHLAPLLRAAEGEPADGESGCIVVIAHGLILGSLLRVLLGRFGAPGAVERLEMSGPVAWSNTGYAELVVERGIVGVARTKAGGEEAASGDRTLSSARQQRQPPAIRLSVVAVNVLTHLEGLKKTRGGIGSARFDKRQRTMESFFDTGAHCQSR
ncbi:hypothetical protein VTJ83DRAFT_6917 [Remersonia thermophila]|uniref:Phosphoglycerate mutase n=1 Tax=Remersonia thermophila TaxID=72144 RepID=A0ABR4D8A9_9PEZI